MTNYHCSPLPLGERVAEGRVRGAPCQKRPLTPAPSPSAGRGENGDPPSKCGCTASIYISTTRLSLRAFSAAKTTCVPVSTNPTKRSKGAALRPRSE